MWKSPLQGVNSFFFKNTIKRAISMLVSMLSDLNAKSSLVLRAFGRTFTNSPQIRRLRERLVPESM